MLPISLTKSGRHLLPLVMLSLTGCGLTQSITDGTTSAVKSIFYKQIKVLRLDFTAREALNTDAHEYRSLSQSVVVRIYQLRDRQAFDKAVYQQLLTEGDSLLKADLLASRDLVVKPGGDVSLDMPMEAEAKFVAITALFRDPDMAKNSWKLVIDREALDADNARVIELGGNGMALRPAKDE